MSENNETHELVKQAYGAVASKRSSCCQPSGASSGAACCGGPATPPTAHPLPESDLGLSCGDPLGFSEVCEGDVVLDLGSGAGRDVFMAAKLTGPAGHVIGVDMTPEMLVLACSNASKLAMSKGLVNVEFRQGYIEALPVDDASVDLVISNCVINLSPDKLQVFREAYRVLKPAGRMVVSDIVLNRPLPEELRNNDTLYTGCIAGALLREDYLGAIHAAGFSVVEVISEHVYQESDAGSDPLTGEVAKSLAGLASSITVKALK